MPTASDTIRAKAIARRRAERKRKPEVMREILRLLPSIEQTLLEDTGLDCRLTAIAAPGDEVLVKLGCGFMPIRFIQHSEIFEAESYGSVGLQTFLTREFSYMLSPGNNREKMLANWRHLANEPFAELVAASGVKIFDHHPGRVWRLFLDDLFCLPWEDCIKRPASIHLTETQLKSLVLRMIWVLSGATTEMSLDRMAGLIKQSLAIREGREREAFNEHTHP